MSDKKNNWAIRTASNLLEGISESEVKRRFPNQKSVDSFTNFLLDNQLDKLDFLGKTNAERRKNLATNLKLQLGLVEELPTSTSTSNNPTDELIDEIFYVDDSQSSNSTDDDSGIDLEDFLKMVEDGDVDNDFTDENNRSSAGSKSNEESDKETDGDSEEETDGDSNSDSQSSSDNGEEESDEDGKGEEGGSEEGREKMNQREKCHH